MKKYFICSLLLILLLSGCGNASRTAAEEIPRGTWPPREEDAVPYVYDPERNIPESGDTEEYAPPENSRITPAEKIKALPQSEPAEFLAYPLDDAFDLCSGLPELYDPVMEAEQQWQNCENGSDEWLEVRDRLFKAYAAYISELNYYGEEANRKLAENFIAEGFPAKVVAEVYTHYGSEAFLYAVLVEATPEEFSRAVKTVPGLMSVDVYDDVNRFRYDTVIWEGED